MRTTRTALHTPDWRADTYSRLMAAATDAARMAGVSADKAMDAAASVATDSIAAGDTLAGDDERTLARMIATRLQSERRAADRITAAMSDTRGVRMDRRNVDALTAEDAALLSDVDVCKRAERLSVGAFDPFDATSVAHARSVVGAWIRTPVRTVRGVRGPVSTCDPDGYAARLIVRPFTDSDVAGTYGGYGAAIAAAVRRAMDAHAVASVSVDPDTSYAEAVHAAHGRTLDKLRATHERDVARDPSRSTLTRTCERMRATLAAINDVLACLPAGDGGWVAYDPDGGTSQRVSALALAGTPRHVQVVVSQTHTQAGAWAPVAGNAPVRGVRYRESGATVGAHTLAESHRPDAYAEWREYADALAFAVYARAMGKRGRGRPAFDVMGALTAYARTLTYVGLGDPDAQYVTLTGDPDAPDPYGLRGRLTAADVLSHPDAITDRSGRTLAPASGVNVTALADALTAAGWKVSRRALGDALTSWGDGALERASRSTWRRTHARHAKASRRLRALARVNASGSRMLTAAALTQHAWATAADAATRTGAAAVIGRALIPTVVRRFDHTHPDVPLRVVTHGGSVIDRSTARNVQAAIAYNRDDSGRDTLTHAPATVRVPRRVALALALDDRSPLAAPGYGCDDERACLEAVKRHAVNAPNDARPYVDFHDVPRVLAALATLGGNGWNLG